MRLCVETVFELGLKIVFKAAASVRLCVETYKTHKLVCTRLAAASVRLCVETVPVLLPIIEDSCSRLRAAVC